MSKNKPHIDIAFVGSLHSGKSTTVGHIIYNKGAISKDAFKAIENEAKKKGNNNNKFAFILDKQKEEQKKKISMDISHWNIESQNYSITLIDTPGHFGHINKTITGISHADFLVLIIDSTAKLTNQIQNLLLVAHALGIDQIIIAINKLDDEDINYDKQKYTSIKKGLISFTSHAGYTKDQIRFIPISGLTGENLTSSSSKLTWWKKGTLIQLIDQFEMSSNFAKNPLRMYVHDFANVPDLGTVVIGPILSGHIKQGQDIYLAPVGIKTVSNSIKKNHSIVKKAYYGDFLSVNIDTPFSRIKKGIVIGDQTNDPPLTTISFLAKMFIVNMPDQIKSGYILTFQFQHQTTQCKLAALMTRTDNKGATKDSPTYAKVNDIIVAKVEPLKPLIVESFKEYPPMGKFVVLDKNETIVAVGTVSSVQKDKLKSKEKQKQDDDDEDETPAKEKKPDKKIKQKKKQDDDDDDGEDEQPAKEKQPAKKIKQKKKQDDDDEQPVKAKKPAKKIKPKQKPIDSDSDDEKPKKKPEKVKQQKVKDDSDSDDEKPKKKPAKVKDDSDSDDEKPKKKPAKAKDDSDSDDEKPKKKPAKVKDDSDSDDEKPKKKPAKVKDDSDSDGEKPKKKPAKAKDDSDSDGEKIGKAKAKQVKARNKKQRKSDDENSSDSSIDSSDSSDNASFWCNAIDAQTPEEFYNCIFKSKKK